MIKTVNNCRLCGSDKIDTILDFTLSPLANAFKNKEDLDKEELQFPLRYFKCSECHSVQLKDEVDSNILFKEYLYESPPNLIPHFKELAATTSAFLGLQKDDLVIDVGSNNGLLLKEYQNLGYKVYGVEPATKIAEKARSSGIPTFNEFFNKEFGQYLAAETCTNCFAHLSDLNDFIEGLKISMQDDSYFVFENAYLLNTIDNLDFGQAYFEHFYMHSIIPLEKLFKKHGLELFHVSYNNVQMGSIRGYVRTKENKNKEKNSSILSAIQLEKYEGLDNIEIYRRFIDNINLIKDKLVNKLEKLKKENKSISVYGWPAKMTLLNKYFGLEKYIDYVIEESPVKTGKYCPGTNLEIKNLQHFKDNPTDYCIVGAYNFFDDIVNKNSYYKGEFISPLKI